MEKQGSKNNGNSQIKDGLPPGDKSTPPYAQVDEFSKEYVSHWRLLIVLVMSIFLAEVAAMILIYELPSLPYIYVTFIDAGVMTALIFPILYFLSFQPLIRHLDSRRRAETELRKAHDEMELRIQDRTEELRIANSELEEEITERRQAEAALKVSEEKYRKLVQYAPAAIYEMNLEGTKFLSVNDVMCDILKYSREELLQTKPSDLLDEESRSLFKERISRKVAGERMDESVIYRVRRKDGTWIYTDINVGEIDSVDEKSSRVVVIGHDVTERKRLEQAIKDSEERYRNIVRLAPAAIYEIDFYARKLLSINDTGCQWLGYSREELLALDPMSLTDEEGRLRFEERIRQKLAGEMIDQTWEIKIYTRDGREITLALNVGEFAYKDGAPVSVLVVAHNITERKHMEEEIRRAARDLQAANEELTRFNKSMVGRELRMIELKKEVNELCECLSQSPRYSPGFDSDEL